MMAEDAMTRQDQVIDADGNEMGSEMAGQTAWVYPEPGERFGGK